MYRYPSRSSYRYIAVYAWGAPAPRATLSESPQRSTRATSPKPSRRPTSRVILGNQEALEDQMPQARALEGHQRLLRRSSERVAVKVQAGVEHGSDSRSPLRSEERRVGKECRSR